MTWDALSTVFVSGIVLASVYAMIASGLSLVWTTLGIFNFAHGALMTLAAYLAWTVSDAAGLGLGMGAGIAVGVAGIVGAGILIERLIVRPFYDNRDMLLITVMTTMAAMIFIEKGTQLLWGARLKQLAPVIPGQVKILGTTISAQEGLIIAIAPVLLGLLFVFLRNSRIGRGIRAVGQNPDAAKLIGIDVSTLFIVTFALSAALAGLTGILLGSVRMVTPTYGAEPLVKGLIIVIFGGLGSLGGTIVAAYLLGLLEAFLIYFIGIYWAPSMIFILLIVVLLVRPQGLLGKVVR
jgi:branched-chain amino acid transport system permease protein